MLLVVVVSALRHVPKPGYGLAPRSHTFSSTGGSVSNIGVSPSDSLFGGLVMLVDLLFSVTFFGDLLMVKCVNRRECLYRLSFHVDTVELCVDDVRDFCIAGYKNKFHYFNYTNQKRSY